ncbi:MAG: hypothetical protein ACKO3W_04340 [bacterium]
MGFTEREKEIAIGMYREYSDAIGQAVVHWERKEWERGLPEVHVALFTHAFGTDVAVFTTEREARAHLFDVAISQCTRDPRTRKAVTKRLGRWPAPDLSEAERDRLIDDWGEVARGEALWTSKCTVEREFSRRKFRDHMEPQPDVVSGAQAHVGS